MNLFFMIDKNSMDTPNKEIPQTTPITIPSTQQHYGGGRPMRI